MNVNMKIGFANNTTNSDQTASQGSTDANNFDSLFQEASKVSCDIKPIIRTTSDLEADSIKIGINECEQSLSELDKMLDKIGDKGDNGLLKKIKESIEDKKSDIQSQISTYETQLSKLEANKKSANSGSQEKSQRLNFCC